MTHQDLFRKYPKNADTLSRSDNELAADFERSRELIDRSPNDAASVSLTVVRDWIAHERRMRIPGLGRALVN